MQDYFVNLKNGRGTVNIKLPADCRVGELLNYKIEVTDSTRSSPFLESFVIKVAVKVTKSTGGTSSLKNKSKMLAPPEVKEITKNHWERYDMERKGALRVYDSGDGIYDFFVNVDNGHLLAEISSINDSEHRDIGTGSLSHQVVISFIALRTF